MISFEASVLTAQVYKKLDQNGTEELVSKMGMDMPTNHDRQEVLNVLHWLS